MSHRKGRATFVGNWLVLPVKNLGMGFKFQRKTEDNTSKQISVNKTEINKNGDLNLAWIPNVKWMLHYGITGCQCQYIHLHLVLTLKLLGPQCCQNGSTNRNWYSPEIQCILSRVFFPYIFAQSLVPKAIHWIIQTVFCLGIKANTNATIFQLF